MLGSLFWAIQKAPGTLGETTVSVQPPPLSRPPPIVVTRCLPPAFAHFSLNDHGHRRSLPLQRAIHVAQFQQRLAIVRPPVWTPPPSSSVSRSLEQIASHTNGADGFFFFGPPKSALNLITTHLAACIPPLRRVMRP